MYERYTISSQKVLRYFLGALFRGTDCRATPTLVARFRNELDKEQEYSRRERT